MDSRQSSVGRPVITINLKPKLSIESRVCLRCGGTYLPTSRNKKYCGRQKVNGTCSWHAGRDSNRKYCADNKELVRSQIQQHARRTYETLIANPAAYAAYLERSRDKDRANRYGVSREQFEAIRTAQNGGCAICGCVRGRMFKGKPRDLAVDHDHETWRIRGLLCDDCNIGLGLFQDDPMRLMNAAVYLAQDPTPISDDRP